MDPWPACHDASARRDTAARTRVPVRRQARGALQGRGGGRGARALARSARGRLERRRDLLVRLERRRGEVPDPAVGVAAPTMHVGERAVGGAPLGNGAAW